MAEFWENDPIEGGTATAVAGNWWENDPVVDAPAAPPAARPLGDVANVSVEDDSAGEDTLGMGWLGRTAYQTAQGIKGTVKGLGATVLEGAPVFVPKIGREYLRDISLNEAREQSRIQEEVAQQQDSWIGGIATNTISSLAKVAASAPAGFTGIVGTQFYDTLMSKKVAALDKGMSESQANVSAVAGAVPEALITSAFQMLGIGGAEKAILNGAKWQGAKKFLGGLLQEFTEEELVTFTTAAADQLSGLDPDALKKSPGQAVDTAAQVAMTMGLIGGYGKVRSFVDNPSRRTAREAGVDKIAPSQRERVKLAEGVRAAAAEAPMSNPGQVGQEVGQTAETAPLDPVMEPPLAESTTPTPTSPVDASLPETAQEPSTPTDAPTDASEGVARAPEEGLAAKNESMAAARESLGLPELPEAERVGWEDSLSEAYDQGIPDRAMDIARGLPAREEPLSAAETAGLLVHGVDLKNQHRAASIELDALTDPADVATKQAELDRIEADFDVLSTALKTTGTAQGRALAIRKMQLDDDYSILAVKRRAKQKAKRELKPNEAKTLERLTKKLEALETHIENGTLPEGVKRTRAESPEAKALRDQIAAARKELAQSEPAQKARLEKSIAELRRRLAEGDYGPRGGKAPPLSPEMEMLEFQRDQIRKEIRAKINGLKPLRKRDIAMEPFNLFRILMTSGDLPPVFRQGGIVTLSRPITSAKAAWAGLKAMFSEQNAWRVEKEIQSRPNAPLYARSKLYLADREGGISAKEEAYANHGLARLAETLDRIPGIKYASRGVKGFVQASERNYVTYLNRLRADTFDAMVANLTRDGEPTMSEATAIANYINVATGRGSFGDMEQAMSALAPVFFSPRYVGSRFQYLAGPLSGFKYGTGSVETRKLIAKEYARTMTGILTVMGLGLAAGAELEDDWTSPDKGKLKFGNTRLDLMGGLSQTAVVTSRALDAAKRTAAAYHSGTKREAGQLRDDALIPWNFARQKFSPLVSAPLDWVAGETVMHETTTPGSTLKNLSVPISFRDIAKTMEEQGIPKGTALFAISLFGGGMNTYEPKAAKPVNWSAVQRRAHSKPKTAAGRRQKLEAQRKLMGQ